MTQYLKQEQYYIDRYDKITIDNCRWKENFHINYKHKSEDGPKGIKLTEESQKAFTELTLHFDLLYTTLYWYDNKEKTIDEWMEADRKKDELYENAVAPRDISCLKCRNITEVESKHLWDHHDDNDRVLFMYKCSNGCLPMRAFYDNGDEHKIKPNLCPKCNTELKRESERIEDKKVITTEICPACNYKDIDEFELSSKEEEKPDPNYERDKERFCLSGKRLSDNLEERNQHQQLKELVDGWKEKEEHKEDYDAVDSLKKLTITELEDTLKEASEKEGYVNLRFENPDMGKDVVVPFLINDSKPERKDRSSSLELQKIIKTTLQDTNWRLMSDGISYRLGILTGRLRAYEREEDLLKLIRQNSS
ncbi:hypothetical protein CL644_01180 [bacterium]|nr:hypothetical protein [bacterium]